MIKNSPKGLVDQHEDIEDIGVRAGIPGLNEYIVDVRKPQGKSQPDVCYG